MKKLLSVVFAMLLVVSSFPVSGFAAVDQGELDTYLAEIQWTEDELDTYLEYYGYRISDFESFEELEDFLGPVITEESLQELLDAYGLTREELDEIMALYGETVEDYLFIDDIEFYIIDRAELDAYLAEIQWTEDELDTYLWEYYGYRISDFISFEELEDFLGPVITEESLQELLDAYGLTREELDEILALYGETVEDYTFIDDIEFYILEELYYEEDYYYDDLFSEFGLTEEELDRLFTHLDTLDFAAIEARLDAVYNRLMALEEFESATELSAEQIAELLSIMQELLDIFEMDATFTLVKSGEEKSISLAELISMTSIEDYDLVISLFSKQGEFLADFILTNEMFGSDLIKETAEDLPVVEEAVETKKEVKAQETAKETAVTGTAAVTKTVKGEKLPYTGANYLAKVLLGLSVLAMGIWAVRRYRRQEA
ncbi:processed acidic surface protein [Jeotgalibacillus haloalkalitolerans]|uniref:Processed acidic surface protein n=1 Tax=Jeotgalibacillus haloalkalitolerans TaxID=3104292 RepID=A0ABU5KJI4_9BACL|nr:processed acidic surface protein [Jeotgalibacillus sp. HH7-29]MDZ5711413.1 processed acidic surface protein [Jeotgalibacillus sp. HH7-29]